MVRHITQREEPQPLEEGNPQIPFTDLRWEIRCPDCAPRYLFRTRYDDTAVVLADTHNRERQGHRAKAYPLEEVNGL